MRWIWIMGLVISINSFGQVQVEGIDSEELKQFINSAIRIHQLSDGDTFVKIFELEIVGSGPKFTQDTMVIDLVIMFGHILDGRPQFEYFKINGGYLNPRDFKLSGGKLSFSYGSTTSHMISTDLNSETPQLQPK